MTVSNAKSSSRAWSLFLYVVIALIFAVAIGLLLIVVNCNQIKQHYIKLIAVINSETHLQIRLVDYKPGWFCSRATLAIPLSGAHGLVLDQLITHGPVVYDSLHKTYAFAPAFIRSHLQLTSSNQQAVLTLAQLETLVTFQNEYFTQLRVPAFKHSVPNDQLAYSGLSGNVFFHVGESHINRFRMNLTSGTFDLIRNGLSVMVGAGQSTADFKQKPIDQWDGVHQIKLPMMAYQLGDKRYQLTKFNYVSRYHIIKENNYTHVLDADIATLSFPEISFNAIIFSTQIENVDPRPFDELAAQSDSGQVRLAQLNQLIPALIKQNTVISGKLEANSSLGKLFIAEKAFWPQNTALPATLENIADQASVVVNIRIAVNLLNKLATLIGKQMDASFPAMPQVVVTPDQQMDQSIDQLVTDNKISTFAASQLKDFKKTKPTMSSYNAYVDHLLVMNEINSDVGTLLKNQYQAMLQAQASQSVAQPLPPKSYEQRASDAIADAVSKGYLVQEQADYVSTIVVDHGVLKLNGRLVNN